MVETGYRELILLRHAKTEHEASSDIARVLTGRGRADARAAGQWLREHDLAPDAILTSSAARAVATAELVGGALVRGEPAAAVEVTVIDELYGASVEEALGVIAALDDSARRVLVVGHNPTAAQLVYDLQREPIASSAELPTAGIAVLTFPGRWRDLGPQTAELVHRHVPRG